MSKKTQDALRKYYSAFNYDTGVKAYKRGGKMGFTTNKFPWGGPTGDTWIPEIDNTTVDEPEVDASIAQYWKNHPDEYNMINGNGSSISSNKWAGLVGTIGSIVGEGMENFNTMDAKEKDLSRRIGSYGQGAYDGITDNLGLIAASNNIGELKDVQREDIRNKSIGQDAFSAVTKGLNAGLSTGNIYVGLGVAAGDIGRSILERIKAGNITDRLNEQTIRRNAQLNHQLRNASEVVDNRNFLRAMQGYYNNPFEYALGGEMRSHGSDWNSGLTFINEGGRHEENPLEGVPSGVDDEGVPNLVEEGEVIWNDEYVFSDRLKVPKELANKYSLGGDKTFAEAIEEVTRESRTRPNDPISNETNRAIVNEFMDAQEALREEEQAKAARQLQTAYDEDFMNQLATFGPQGEVPMQEGLQLPPQGVNEEGMPIEGAPVGFALGGNKFNGGGPKVVKVGNRYFITTEGAPKITGKMYGNRFVVDDQFKNLPSFDSFEEANREVDRMVRSAMPALESQANIEASGVTAYTGDKIIKERTGSNTKGQPTYRYTVIDPNTGKKHYYSNYQEAARKYSSIPRKVNDPRVRGGYAYVTPYGDIHLSEKSAKNALNARFNPQSTSAKTSGTSTNRGIITTANAAEPPARTVEPQTQTVEQPDVKQPAVEIEKTAVTQVTSPVSSRGSTGRMTTPSGETINYRRDINGKDWESAEAYQNFLSYMRGKGKDSPEVKEWMDYIQSEIKNSGSKYELKNFDDWSRLAEDGKVGPVHQATLLAAQNYAERQNAPQLEGPVQAPQSGNTVTPSSSKDFIDNLNAAIEATRGTQQGTAEAPRTQPATPNFEYEPTWQRMAPVYGAGAAALYGMINRPDYFNADSIIDAARAAGVPVNIPVQTIGDYRVRNPFDERYLVNMANQNMAAGQRSIYNTSGGNRAMDMLGAMSLAYNNQLDLGEIMRQAYLANRQDDAQVAEFNRGTNIQNMNAINQRNLTQAQLNSQRQATALSGISRGYGVRQGIKDNWDAATMQSINSLLTSLGAIGKENEENNILKSMAEQGYFPYYYGNRSVLQNVPRTVSKNGGNKLNKKKRRF